MYLPNKKMGVINFTPNFFYAFFINSNISFDNIHNILYNISNKAVFVLRLNMAMAPMLSNQYKLDNIFEMA